MLNSSAKGKFYIELNGSDVDGMNVSLLFHS